MTEPDKAVERLILVGHARDLENYLSGTLLERPNFNATRLLGQLADAIENLEAQLAAQFRALEEATAWPDTLARSMRSAEQLMRDGARKDGDDARALMHSDRAQMLAEFLEKLPRRATIAASTVKGEKP